jgi:hypothetical protein
LLILQRKAQRLDKMQPGAGIGAEADDVTGVRRNFWLIENNVEHEDGKCITAALVFSDVG